MTAVSRDTLSEKVSSRRKYNSPARAHQHEETRARLIRIVLDFAIELNFRPGLKAITERAGTHLSIVHRHFGSLDGLYAAVAEQHDGHVCDCAVEGAGAMLSPARRRELAYVIMTGHLPEEP